MACYILAIVLPWPETQSGALAVLNAAALPWPGENRGLFDIGPFIGLFVMALGGRLVVLGRRVGR